MGGWTQCDLSFFACVGSWTQCDLSFFACVGSWTQCDLRIHACEGSWTQCGLSYEGGLADATTRCVAKALRNTKGFGQTKGDVRQMCGISALATVHGQQKKG